MTADIKFKSDEVVVEGVLSAAQGAFKVALDGSVTAFVTSSIKPMAIMGQKHLGRPAAVWMFAQDVVLGHQTQGADGQYQPVHPNDRPANNYALSHMEGDTLVLNRGGGYKGGVRVEGGLKVGDLDVASEIAALKAEIEALKSKVG